jgi:hypothetical protein
MTHSLKTLILIGVFVAVHISNAAVPVVTERGAHHRVWQKQTLEETPSGTRTNVSSYTELATGLHYLENGEWQESRAEIEIVADGGQAIHGRHRIHLNGNANNVGAINITTPDNKTLRAHVLGLAYRDSANNQSVMFAQIRNSDGLLFPPNQVLYPNAFSGTLADIRYSYTRSAVEQDVILRERLPPPATFNLNNETTFLEVWTEFDEAPERIKSTHTIHGVVDESLNFGEMRMVRGGVFALDAPLNKMHGASVTKTWLKEGNRTFLIESVRYSAIQNDLNQLPPPQAKAEGQVPQVPDLKSNSRAELAKLVPSAKADADAKPIQMALDRKLLDETKGLVLDYVLLAGADSVRLEGDKTYSIGGDVTVWNDLTTEGGAVVKYDVGYSLLCYGAITFLTDHYRQAIFTAKDDDTVGERISGSTGSPSGHYGSIALYVNYNFAAVVQHVRFSYFSYGIFLDVSDIAVRHAQFVDCHTGLDVEDSSGITADNALFLRSENVTTVAAGSTVTARHITAHQCNNFTYEPGGGSTLNLTNSLLVNTTNWGTSGYNTNAVVKTTDEGALQAIGAGAHYLADNSTYRNAGTTNIPAFLVTDLRLRTTYPPLAITNAMVTTNLTLRIQSPRCTNVPIGYAYAPLDYVFGSNVLTNATLTIPAGVAVGTFTPGSNTHGLLLLSGANLVTSGSPTNLARIVRYNTVQEQASAAWSATNVGAQIRVPTNNTAPVPTGNFRFTDWSVPALEPLHVDLLRSNTTAFVFRDCQFAGGKFRSGPAEVAFTNCLFVRLDGVCEEAPATVTNRWYNTTSYGGRWSFFNTHGGKWEIFNNIFYNTTDLTVDTSLLNGWNAFLPGAPVVNTYWSNDVVTNIVFEAGPLGGYYLPTNSPLTNRGSMNATDAAMYHFTTTTNQHKETNSIVDIGFHYVALNAANFPVDTDGEGLADYAEDVNGNGTTESTDTDVNDPDTDYDGRNDFQEAVDGTLGYDPASAVRTNLAFFPFDETNWLGRAGQTPLAKTNLTLGDAWLTKALQLDNGTNGFLRYRDVETNYLANINLRNGAVRFWFCPAWVSGGTAGPRSRGRLIEVGTEGSAGGGTNGWWALYFNTNATNITFTSQTNNLGTNYFTASFTNGCEKDWHQFVLNYTPTNTALYIDAVLAASGTGVLYWPDTNVRGTGFRVGSDTNGTNQAKGVFEDLELFNYPLSESYIAENFCTNSPPNAIPNLKMWLRGDLGWTLNPSPRVEKWIDQTCNEDNAVQLTILNKPFLSSNEINGRAAVRFYTTNYFSFTNFPGTSVEAEAFVLVKVQNAMPANYRALWNLKGNSQPQYYPDTNGWINDDFGRSFDPSGGENARPTAASLDQPHLYNVSTSSNEWTSRINGVIHHSTPSNSVGWPAGTRQLGTAGGYYFDGYVAEVLMYDRVLTEAERKCVERYMNQRYAFISSAPAAPSNVVAQAVSPTQVSVTWDASLSNTNVNFTLERKQGAGSYSVVGLLRQKASYFDAGLATNTTYSYRVKADNWSGYSAYSDDASVTTLSSGVDVPLSSLRVWLKSDTGRGNLVVFWQDQSGNGSHCLAEAASNRVVVVSNGIVTNKPTLGFYLTNILTFKTFPQNDWTAADGFFVMKAHTSSPPVRRGQWHFGSGLHNGYPETNGLIYDAFFRTTVTIFAESFTMPGVNLVTNHLYRAQSTSNSWKNWLNGSSYISTNFGGFYRQAIPKLGYSPTSSDAPNATWDGEFTEIMIFNAALTTNQVQAVQNYLRNRYLLW